MKPISKRTRELKKLYEQDDFEQFAERKFTASKTEERLAKLIHPIMPVTANALWPHMTEKEVVIKGHKALVEELGKIKAEKKRPLSVISIGAGDLTHEMWLKKEFPGIHIEARDKYGLMRARGRWELRKMGAKKARIKLERGDFANPNATKNTILPRHFDLVYSLDALHWEAQYADPAEKPLAIERTKKALKKMTDLVKFGGKGAKLLITYRPAYKTYLEDKAPYVLDPDEIKKMLIENGLGVKGKSLEPYFIERDKIKEKLKNGEKILKRRQYPSKYYLFVVEAA